MIVYDSTNPNDIPTTAQAVAPYVDGLYGPEHNSLGSATGWDEAAIARFPNAIKIGIAVFATTNDGQALDVEQYDATPAQAPSWVHMRLAAGAQLPLLIYCNRANGPAVESALDAGGFHPGDGKVALWPATLDGNQTVIWNNGAAPRYPVALIQYANSTISGGHYDLSITTAYGDSLAVLSGVEMLSADDPIVKQIYADLGLLMQQTAAVYNFLSNPEFAKFNTGFDELKADLDALKAQVAALPAPPAPVVTATVSGTFTGTVHP